MLLPDCFNHYNSPLNDIALPERFNYPFNYQPHVLCQIAANELQQHLLTQTEWVHDFGIDNYVDATNIGKMFGVMAVRAINGEIGYLAAFSGKLAGKNNLSRFVPPHCGFIR
jgi:tRNA pseudouridine32 synthase/23S rRNA pseudouridine746 synthase